MPGHRFLSDKIGIAALASVAAMVAFNIFAISYHLDHLPSLEILSAVLHPVALA